MVTQGTINMWFLGQNTDQYKFTYKTEVDR